MVMRDIEVLLMLGQMELATGGLQSGIVTEEVSSITPKQSINLNW